MVLFQFALQFCTVAGGAEPQFPSYPNYAVNTFAAFGHSRRCHHPIERSKAAPDGLDRPDLVALPLACVRAIWVFQVGRGSWRRALSCFEQLRIVSGDGHPPFPIKARIIGVTGSRACAKRGAGLSCIHRPQRMAVDFATRRVHVKSAWRPVQVCRPWSDIVPYTAAGAEMQQGQRWRAPLSAPSIR